jgi:hypothetical protein
VYRQIAVSDIAVDVWRFLGRDIPNLENLKLMKVLTGKQGKLDVALFSKKSGASSVSTSSSVPTSVVSRVIRSVPVHEIQDFPNSWLVKRKLRFCSK